MSDPTEKISDWENMVSYLQRTHPVDMAWRGQDAAYGHVMKARLDRCLHSLNMPDRLRMERAVCQRFREHAPIYLSEVERRYLATRWLELVVMQHYGAPTRLLDWTKSAWVAVFFAVSGGWDSDGYLYGFRRDRLERCMKERFGAEIRKRKLVWGPHLSDSAFADRKWDLAEANDSLFDLATVKSLSEWVATYYCREAHFPRLVAQQGLFTFGSKPDVDHWQNIRTLLPKNDCFVIRIDCLAKPEFLRRLNTMGLNGATLFPGADGIGRSLEGFARAWHLKPRPSQFPGPRRNKSA